MTNQASAGGSSLAAAATPTVPNLHTIDDVLAFVRTTNDHHLQLQALNKLCSREKGRGAEALALSTQSGTDPLSILLPRQNCDLALLYVLVERLTIASTRTALEAVQPYLDGFLAGFQPAQLAGAGPKVVQLAQLLHNLSGMLRDASWAVPRLCALFERNAVSFGPQSLTPLHPILTYQCLLAEQYVQAETLTLSRDVTYATRGLSNMRSTDVLEHFYYGALVLLKLHKWQRAADFLETCICLPAQAVSAIQVDAYKKLVLLQLLMKGKTSPLPKHTSAAFQKHVRHSSQASGSLGTYEQLARLYAAAPTLNLGAALGESAPPLRDVAEGELGLLLGERANDFANDTNSGFVRLLSELYPLRRIERLQKTFSTLTLGDVAKLLQLDAPDEQQAAAHVEAQVLQIVELGWLHARITPPAAGRPPTEAQLHFEAAPERHRSEAAVARLEGLMHTLAQCNDVVASKERAVARSHVFLNKAQNSNRSQGYGGAASMFGGMEEDLDDDAFAM